MKKKQIYTYKFYKLQILLEVELKYGMVRVMNNDCDNMF